MYLPSSKKINAIQMLIACQDSKPFNSQLGEVIQCILQAKKNVFKALLVEMETGSDLKLKEVVFTMINLAIDNVSSLAKRLLVRALIMNAGFDEAFLLCQRF
jgi:hypothetical protein